MKNLLILAFAAFLLLGGPLRFLLILLMLALLAFGGVLKTLLALPFAAGRFIGGSVKKLLAVLAAVTLMFCLTGCDKDQVIGVYNQVLQLFDAGVTSDDQLCGQRTAGSDSYTGQYEAQYQGFTGTETLFGGTALQREAGDTLELSCELSQTDGSLKVEWLSGIEEPKLLFDSPGTHTATLRLPAGSNYIRISAEDFTGSISLEVR